MAKSAFGSMLAASAGMTKRDEEKTAPTLAEVKGSENLRDAISAATGARVTEQDVADAISALLLAVSEEIRSIIVAACHATGAKVPTSPRVSALKAEDVRISTKDGAKVYAYAVVKRDEDRARTFGVTIGGTLGKVFAPVALRK